jgi:hypothetical protein
MGRLQSWLSFFGRLLAANPYGISDGVRTPDGNGTVVAIDRDAVKVFFNCRRERWYTVRQVEFVTYRRAA